jgi:hypothetical protein
MSAPQEDRKGWTIEDAERLLMSLKGVVSARLVTRPGGEVEEIHLLTTEEVSAKQTVRNVESALLAHLDLGVDHRKISVAQTKERPAPPAPPAKGLRDSQAATEPAVRLLTEPPLSENRLLFHAHQLETERSHQVRHRVDIEWRGTKHTGMASAADLPRPRIEAVAKATLAAVEAALTDELADGGGMTVTLSLDGVQLVDAFDRKFVLVAVNAMAGRNVTSLAGAAVVDLSMDRATILASLQATDRWVRGRV